MIEFWTWLLRDLLGDSTSDVNAYATGELGAVDYSNAIELAWAKTAPGSAERIKLVNGLFDVGAASGDKTYWINRPTNAADVGDFFKAAEGLAAAGKAQSDSPVESLPKGSRLVKVGAEYRVIWDLGDGLGWAWYSVSPDQLKEVYGDNYNLYVTESLGNSGVFEAKYGNNYWGNVAEVDLKADTPWDDLSNRTFEAYGYVAGIEDPEIKRLILQGYFEGWTANEFLSHYQNTNYYQTTTETQRAWAVLSDTEKASQISAKVAELVDDYRGYWGVDPAGGLDNADLIAAATAILSGESSQAEWDYNTRTAAAADPNTPAGREVTAEEQARGEEEVSIEAFQGSARDAWLYWMGPVDIPPNFLEQWGRDLYMNYKSEEDLETALRELSMASYINKPENIGWSEWAAPVKANMRSTLELTTVDDQDPLLSSILSQGLMGQEANLAIRQDPRFRQTNTLYQELAGAAESLGRSFGFIA